MKKWLSLMFAISGVSCTTVPTAPRVYLGSTAYLGLPQPKDVQTIKAVQVITFRKEAAGGTFETIFENKNNVMTVSVLSPMWPTPMTATYDGATINVDSRMKKAIPLDFKYVIADLMLIYASAESLRRNLNLDSELIVENKTRRLINRKTAKAVSEITFEHEDPFKGEVRLANLSRGYNFKVKTLKVER